MTPDVSTRLVGGWVRRAGGEERGGYVEWGMSGVRGVGEGGGRRGGGEGGGDGVGGSVVQRGVVSETKGTVDGGVMVGCA